MGNGRRVVVTGMGAVSSLGVGVPTIWENILAGKSGIAPITHFDASDFSTKIAGEVKDFDPTNHMDRKEARRTDRFVQFAIAAAKEAIASAELSITPDNRDEIGVVFGSGIGGLETMEAQVETLRTKGPGRVSPFTVPSMIVDMAAGHISIMTGARGPNFCVTSACASSAHCIGEASENIRHGRAKAMIVGGSEAPITPLGVAGFNSARAISTRNDEPTTASRPFDATRDGFVLSEGSAALVLEDYEFAVSRGAPILAELIGYGSSGDAFHVTQPPETGEGAALAMAAALRRAEVAPSDIDYVNMHGTSTSAGDIAETAAVRSVFGEAANTLALSSTKSQLGHMLGAAGAIEMIMCVFALQHSIIPPTMNLHTPDPKCDLDYVPHTPRTASLSIVVNNSFGFGGHNASLVLKKYEA